MWIYNCTSEKKIFNSIKGSVYYRKKILHKTCCCFFLSISFFTGKETEKEGNTNLRLLLVL